MEFGGVYGVSCLMIVLPLTVYAINLACGKVSFIKSTIFTPKMVFSWVLYYCSLLKHLCSVFSMGVWGLVIWELGGGGGGGEVLIYLKDKTVPQFCWKVGGHVTPHPTHTFPFKLYAYDFRRQKGNLLISS